MLSSIIGVIGSVLKFPLILLTGWLFGKKSGKDEEKLDNAERAIQDAINAHRNSHLSDGDIDRLRTKYERDE